MKNLTFLFLLLGQCLIGQVAPNFTITDTEGEVHDLYADYLDKGTTVVIKMFFIDCPICKPYNEPFQQLYEEFGEGQDSVEFLLLTTKTWDTNEEIAAYKNQYGLTFPGSGLDGGGYEATAPYRNGDFGTFFGAPTFLVIEPNKTVHFDLAASGVTATLAKVRDKINEVRNNATEMVETSEIEISIESHKEGQALPTHSIKLRSASNPENSYVVPKKFTYPSFEYPAVEDPEIIVEIIEKSNTDVTTIDIVVIQRHILGILTLDPLQLLAADVNGSQSVSTADLLSIRKVILSLKDEFNIGKSWQAINEGCLDNPDLCIEAVKLDPELDQQNINFRVIKYGDVK